MRRKSGGKSRSRAQKAQKRYNDPRSSSGTTKKQPASKSGRQRPKTLTGRVQKNPRGFAFIVATDRSYEDVFVGNREAAPLMTDDIVEFSIEQHGRKPEAHIHKILKHGQTEMLGRVRESKQGYVLETEQGEKQHLDGVDRRDVGQWVIAHIEEYPTPEDVGLVTLKEALGPELTPKHDIKIAVSRYNLEEDFSSEAIRVAEHARSRAQEEFRYPGSRRDQRDLPYVTIDGEDAKDFDDAILVETPRRGPAFILYVAIADVSFFVERGSALDREARKRGTSVYFPGFCLPMLPETLSNDLCSLRPQQERLAFTAEMHFDRDGILEHAEFYPALIKTAKRCTYTSVQGYLDKRNPYYEDMQPVAGQIDRAYELYRKLLRQRQMRGVLDFDLPECKIEVDREGNPVRLRHSDRFEANKLIEEFMIAANMAVARELRETETLALYRVHEPPEPDALDALNTTLRNMGIPHTVKEVSPRAFSKVLEQTKDLPLAPTLHQQILRLQKQAHYEPEPKGHFGLALRDYTHFTSPIRRYPDLVVHRALRNLLERKQSRLSVDEFVSLGETTSACERKAMEAERFVSRRKQCWFMLQHLGKTFPGRITGVVEKGIFVEIGDFATDGFVPLEFLPGNYTLDERHMCLRRNPGNDLLKVGDKIEIEVVKVSVDDAQITLGAVEAESSLRPARDKFRNDRDSERPRAAASREKTRAPRRDDRDDHEEVRSTSRPTREKLRAPQRDDRDEARPTREKLRSPRRDEKHDRVEARPAARPTRESLRSQRPDERDSDRPAARPERTDNGGRRKRTDRRNLPREKEDIDWREPRQEEESRESSSRPSGLERVRAALATTPVVSPTGEYVRPKDHAPRKPGDKDYEDFSSPRSRSSSSSRSGPSGKSGGAGGKRGGRSRR